MSSTRTSTTRTSTSRTSTVRALSVLAAGTLLSGTGLALAGPASAHVHVDAQDATKGAESTLITVRVPNEKDSATTTQVEVTLPADHPIAFVRPGAVPGWTATTTRTTLTTPLETEFGAIESVVGTITWTAQPGTTGIDVGTFQLFQISAGPLPTDVDSLAFATTQTYSDGEAVAWDQPTPADGQEPEFPLPEFGLADAPSGDDETVTPATAASPGGEDGGSGGLWLGAAGLVLGAAGAVMGGAALRRSSGGARTSVRPTADVTS